MVHADDQDELRGLRSAFKSGKWPFPEAIPCKICGKKARNVRHLGYCENHWRERKHRQHQGVPLEELSSLWDDTLAAWKDRPEQIREEPAELFEYRRGDEGWHLFSRGYHGRLPDWIAYNAPTGEVRRFAGVGREDVMEDLLDGNRAPNQEELLRHWGTPEPNIVREMKLRMMMNAEEGIRTIPTFSAVVRDLHIPVYGLYGGELRPLSFEYGGGGAGDVHIAMRYGPPKAANAEIAAFLETRNRRFKVLRQEPELKRWELMSFGETLLFYAGRDRLSERLGGEVKNLGEAYGEAEPLSLQATLLGFQHVIGMRWNVPEALTLLLAENDDTQLRMGTLGLEDSEFIDLLSEVRRVDNDPDLVAKHNEIFARRLREIEEQWR